MPANVSDFAILSRLLDEALDIDPAQVDGWLDSLPRAQRHLAPRLRAMFAMRLSNAHAGFMVHGPQLAESEAAATAVSLRHGDRIGPYALVREIGRGGMGEVWLAERADGAPKRQVALKLPHVQWQRADFAQRLERERAILSTLDHPGITKLLEAGVHRSVQPYLVLDYVDGEPIDAHCRRHALDVRGRLMLFVQAADAVSYAHRRQVLHRDLKPANVLVTLDGSVRLLDFGIAKLLDNGLGVETELTQQWGRPLTPEYASPEQLRGDPAGIVSDVYSLGVILYVLLSATCPHRREGRSAAAFEQAVLGSIPPLPSEVASEPSMRQALTGAMDAVVMKALRKPMHERYGSVAALVDDVRRFLDRRPVCALDDPTVTRRSGEARNGPASTPSRGWPARDVVLIGRQTDRAAVADLLRSRRLVCVVGHGGVGKTGLACAVAGGISDEFADGAAWVDLAALTSELQLAPAIAAAMGIELPAGGGPELLHARLASRHALVLLDNCEHLLAPVAALVEELLTRTTALRVLATSREPLRVGGEQVYRLDPLPTPPATADLARAREYAAFQLLAQRIARADMHFEFDDRLASVGAEICQALDGLPLAIEMAAAWVPKVGIDGLREMLHERLRMLRGAQRGQPLRQRSLRDVLDWSYGLLAPQEQLALRRLSAFAGHFDIESAERMIADEAIDRWAARDLLASLVDKSLVSVEHAGALRYRLLETTRLYLVERAQDAAESRAIEQRHGALMAALAQKYLDAAVVRDDAYVFRFQRYYTEFEHAFEHACRVNDANTSALTLAALRNLDFRRGIAVGMEARLASAARLLANAAPVARALILTTIASCGWVLLPSISRAEAARLAVAHWRVLPDEVRWLRHALFMLAINAAGEGFPEEARAALQEAIELSDLTGNPLHRMTALISAAHTEGLLGDPRSCLNKLREALPLACAGGRRGFDGYVQVHLIEAAVAAGEWALALELAPDMIRSMRAAGQREYLVITSTLVARAGQLVGDLEAARVALAEALPLAWECNREREFLEPLAHFAAKRGLVRAAASLSGFAQGLGAAGPPATLSLRGLAKGLGAEALAICRAAMEPLAFERAIGEGAAMSVDACRELAASVLAASDVRSIDRSPDFA